MISLSKNSRKGRYSGVVVAGLLCLAFLPSGCKGKPMTDYGTPLRISGEVFLNDSDERTKVSCGQAMTIELCNMLDTGKTAGDRKDQGAAALTIVYSNGKEEHVEVTQEGLVRRGKRVVQVNKQQMMNLLQQMLRECAIPDTTKEQRIP